ncbi:D-glycero-beta-D-manno-heptose 1-phosphate adenylyltransferase [Cytophagaceae bacterium ABcell3]|nr:D-glycero-beta-D-manno-heptose 1-phosphate adenylyltransferase [Cytophagaceae bacterium ABcell3]
MKTADKIKTIETIQPFLDVWRKEGKIVFTNGCFDILHLGHVDYLEKTRNLGHKLILGLNTDRSISTVKGPQRPVQDEVCRARVMASLACVDAVILFGEETPYNLIKAIKPDILAKGDDYTIDKIIGREIVVENGGEVLTVPLINGYSTTNIINKIKKF